MIPWSREYGISIGTGHTGGKMDRFFLREKSSQMSNLACLDLSEELFEVWLVESMQFFMANFIVIVVSGQTLWEK